jgi:Putative transposase
LITRELRPIQGEYVNYEFLHNKFRNKFIDELVELYTKEKLQHKFEDKISLLKYLKQINKTRWSIHLEPPMPAPSAVIRYIGRYSKRACISEHKITEIDGEYISFRYKDYKETGPDKKPVEKILRLHYKEFFPRLLQHVPLAYFRLVRYYGLYSTKNSIPEAYLNNETEEEEEWEWENPFVCKVCKKPREYMYTIIDIRTRKEQIDKFNHMLHPSYKFKRA